MNVEPKLTPFDLSILTLLASGVKDAEIEQKLSSGDARQVANYLKGDPNVPPEIKEVGEALREQAQRERVQFPVRSETPEPGYDA